MNLVSKAPFSCPQATLLEFCYLLGTAASESKRFWGSIGTVSPPSPLRPCHDWALTLRQGVSAPAEMLDWELAEDQGPVWVLSIRIGKAVVHSYSEFRHEALQADTSGRQSSS